MPTLLFVILLGLAQLLKRPAHTYTICIVSYVMPAVHADIRQRCVTPYLMSFMCRKHELLLLV